MILPDVNVLVFAYRRESPRHRAYAEWLSQVRQSDEVALLDVVLAGFVRIVTHPRIYADPAPTDHALSFVELLRRGPRARELGPTAAAWRELAGIAAADRAVRGNLVPDAFLAATARAHGCRVATADRGFARFDGVDWFDPAPPGT